MTRSRTDEVMALPATEYVRRLTLVVCRLGLAFLFFSQLFWKLPPHFGCPDGHSFVFTTADSDGTAKRSTGLCDWIGIESIWAHHERSFFVIDLDNDGKPDFALHLRWLVRLNGWFVDSVVMPHFRLFGWLIFATEAFIALSLFFGILSRLGAVLSLLLSVQLMLGIAGASDPAIGLQEWEWSYHLMVLLSLVLVGSPSGRLFGFDALLRRRLLPLTARGNHAARLALSLT